MIAELNKQKLVRCPQISKEFIWTYNHYGIVHGQSLTADIKLEVGVETKDKILLQKTIDENVERKPTFSNLWAGEDMLSECLTLVIKKVVSDYNVITAIKRFYGKGDSSISKNIEILNQSDIHALKK